MEKRAIGEAGQVLVHQMFSVEVLNFKTHYSTSINAKA